MTISIRRASEADIPLLAEMNHQLIADEKHRNPMSVDQLADRLRRFFAEGYEAALLSKDQNSEEECVVGYGLYQFRPDAFQAGVQTVRVRQFFIQRSMRRMGYGREGFEAMVRACFPNASVELEVLETNAPGRAFWQSLGFEPYSITMKRPATEAYAAQA